MSGESKHNIDELLSGYVDGELSERKYTELKRLMLHDPALEAKFTELKKQRDFLNSMPIEKAPQGLLAEVVALQERKFILNGYSEVSTESEGIKHLFFRRALTAAVMLVLFGGLGGLIYKIVAPVQMADNKDVASGNFDSEIDLTSGFVPVIGETAKTVVDTPVFRASLDLKTEHAISMNSFIMKTIFKHDLNDFVDPPENEGTSSTIRITCGIDSIVAILGDLQSEWDKCKEANLSVYDHALAREVVIKKISSSQVMDIFTEDKFYTRMQIVKTYADFSGINLYGNRAIAINKVDAGSGDMVKPELTSAIAERSITRIEGGERISLVITVTGL